MSICIYRSEKDSILDWPQILLDFCQHIAAGMDYLHKKGFIHRDLAARNILVAADNTCKVCKFICEKVCIQIILLCMHTLICAHV